MSEREHVDHYCQGKVETIDQIFELWGFEGGMCFVLGNLMKYTSRAMYKGQLRSDLEKISNYATIGIEKFDEHEAEEESQDPEQPFGFQFPKEKK